MTPRTAFLSIAFFASFGVAHAQAISGDLSGSVFDSSGALLPGASVTARHAGMGTIRRAEANNTGQYRFVNLPLGGYVVSASSSGFATVTMPDVQVELNKVATLNFTLPVAAAVMSVEVSGAGATLDTTTAQVQSSFHGKTVELSPLSAANLGVLNMALMASGVTGNGGVGAGVGPSVGGQRPRHNNFTVEGVDNNDKAASGPKVNVPNEAVSEFTLLKNQFAPEFGRSSGGQFNVAVKSGSNGFHGSLYEYLQNRHLNAADVAFQRQGITEKPRRDVNRLGATGGGALIRDRWFYFGNLEMQPVGNASTPPGDVLTPTAEGYRVLDGIKGLSPANLGILKEYAPASATAVTEIPINGVSVPFGPLAIVGPNNQNNWTAVASSDYTISERDQLRGRFILNRTSFTDIDGVSLPAFYLQNSATRYLASVAEYHTFSASLLNEFRLGYNRQNQLYSAGNFAFPGLSAFPNLMFDDTGLQIGPNPMSPQGGVQNTYQATDNLTWVRGAHTLSIGTEFRKYISPTVYTQRSRGDYEYSSIDLFLRDQTPDVAALRGIGNVRFYGDQIGTYWYGQDSWRIRRGVTLNLGLRYEFNTLPFTSRLQTLNAAASVPGVLEFAEPKPQRTALAPRLGLAWSPGQSGKTSIRTGFGMAYDVLADNLSIMALPPQLGTTLDVTGAGIPDFLKSGGIPDQLAGATAMSPEEARANTGFYVPLKTKVPYSVQWNVGVERVLAGQTTVAVQYVGTRGVHLPVQQQINRTPRVTAASQIPMFLTAPDPAKLAALPLSVGDLRARSETLPRFEQAGFLNPITAWTPEGKSAYHGLSFEVNRRLTNGLQLSGSYTWSHALDNSTSEVGSTFLTPRRAQDSQNLRPEWSTSMLDRRHRFTAMAVYVAPWFRNSGPFCRNVLGNWEFAPTYLYESPEYFTVQSGIDSNLNGDSAGDRAWLNPQGIAHTASEVYGLDRAGNRIGISDLERINGIVAWVAENPNARYVRAGYGVLPTSGRNTEPSRPINNINLSVMKRVPISERAILSIGAQAYNLFNHAQFVPGLVHSIDAVTTAYTPAVRNFATAGNSSFGDVEGTFGSNPRVIQMIAKLSW